MLKFWRRKQTGRKLREEDDLFFTCRVTILRIILSKPICGALTSRSCKPSKITPRRGASGSRSLSDQLIR